jgi:hypothetical protein
VSGRAKFALVAAGYVVAFLVAFGVVALYVTLTSGPDRQLSGGMYAFGDSLLFLGVFGLASVPASGAALFFLRPYPWVWRTLSVVALLLAATGVAALIVYLGAQGGEAAAGSVTATFQAWSALAILRILVAPLFALAFGVAAVFAPGRSPRVALGAACLADVIVFAWVTLTWVRMSQSP